MTESDAAPDAEAIAKKLTESVGLKELLADKEVKAALIQELRDLSVPAPGMVYRLLVAIVGKSESFFGQAVISRLQAFIDRSPRLAALIQRIANLQHGAEAKDNLRQALLEAVREGKPVDIDDHAVDEATSVDVVLALHSVQGFDNVLTGLDEQTQNYTENLRDELAGFFHDITAPHLSWPPEAMNKSELGAFDRLKYNSGIDDLYGREDALDMLWRFVGDLSMTGKLFQFQWLLLTAEGGSGKTRLAYDFTEKHLDRKRWDAGKLDLTRLETLSDPAKWRPKKPTLIVVDYAQSMPERIRDLLIGFAENAAHYDVPVRLLLLERSADTSWTDRMLPNDSWRPIVLEHCHGNEGPNGRPLPPVGPGAIFKIMENRFRRAGLSPPQAGELFHAARKIDKNTVRVKLDGENTTLMAPRPLFAAAAAEEWIAARLESPDDSGDIPPKLDRETVLKGIIERERHMRWRKHATDVTDLKRHEMLLALATLVQGLDMAVLDEKNDRFGAAANWLPKAAPSCNDRLVAAMGGKDGYLPQLEPDILGEFFVLQTLTQNGLTPAAQKALLTGAVTLNPPQPLIVLLRMLGDFPARSSELRLTEIVADCHDLDVARQFAGLAPDYVNICAEQGGLGRAGDYLDAVRTLQNRFSIDETVARDEAMAVYNATLYAAKAGDWKWVDSMLARLVALSCAFPANADIAVLEAKNLLNQTIEAREADDWTRTDSILVWLETLRRTFPTNVEIALEIAKAAVVVTGFAVQAGDLDRFEKMLEQLRELARQWGPGFELFKKDEVVWTLGTVIEAAELMLNDLKDKSQTAPNSSPRAE